MKEPMDAVRRYVDGFVAFDQYSIIIDGLSSVRLQVPAQRRAGRLTLNVLLSFAQFERELIGERVRDKIAASKRKGIWVGGPVPLGYAAVDKKVLVVPAEAEAVRTIFERYLALSAASVRIVNSDAPGRSEPEGRKSQRRSAATVLPLTRPPSHSPSRASARP
jgi:hypothetical protein